jgi:hypothetical protein
MDVNQVPTSCAMWGSPPNTEVSTPRTHREPVSISLGDRRAADLCGLRREHSLGLVPGFQVLTRSVGARDCIGIRKSKHWRRIVPISRSQNALAVRDRSGVLSTRTPKPFKARWKETEKIESWEQGWGVGPLLFDAPYNEVTDFWGYTNVTSGVVTIPFGSHSFFKPSPSFRGQPITFDPGTHHFVFSATFVVADTQTLTWTLNGIAETASNDPSRYCAGASVECWDTNGNSVCDLASEDINGDGKCDALECQGRIGATGPKGDTGAQGQPGSPCPPGVSGLSAAIRAVTVPATAATATASCNTNEAILNGGAMCTIPNSNSIGGRVASSAPSGSNGWTVTCSAGQATAVALCAAKP